MSEKISELQKALNDLNSTSRLARYLSDHLPAACDLAPGEGDPNLWCVFDVIADRLESIDERLEVELAKNCRARRLAVVDNGGAA